MRLEGNFHIVTGQISHIQNINRSLTRAGMPEPTIVWSIGFCSGSYLLKKWKLVFVWLILVEAQPMLPF
ncbi:MAG: hypothetical protein IPO64_11565 [Bacteroidetes bacterium]|nr:hypothetical protein [Bacteroidota bacterium]